MKNKEILEKIKKMPSTERRNIKQEDLMKLINLLTVEEIVELSNIIGYPVFTRMCMGPFQHKFVLLQDGAAAIIINDKDEILLQSRADNEKWGLPGGCQELGERFEDTIIREVKEETNLTITEENLELITIVSGNTRKNVYPNGDVVYNNTALYRIKNYQGEIKKDYESKELKFFALNHLPKNQHDPDLIEVYKNWLQNKSKYEN